MSVADITVSIPYYNEAKSIRMTLGLLKAQTLAPKEVYLVNSSSTDDSSAIIDEWIRTEGNTGPTKFYNVFEGTNTPSSSKNVGIRRSTCQFVAFMDCGQVFQKEWLQLQYEYLMAHPEADWVSGTCHFKGKGLIDECAIAQTYGHDRARAVIPSSLVRKHVFEKCGMFLENRRAGYDAAWPLLLEKKGMVRGVNEKVVIRYENVNFGGTLKGIFKKSILYATPTVNMPHYYVPYYYVGALAIGLLTIALVPVLAIGVIGAYLITRGLLIPTVKSNGIGLAGKGLQYWTGLALVGAAIDAGRLIGIFKGVYKYHVKGEAL